MVLVIAVFLGAYLAGVGDVLSLEGLRSRQSDLIGLVEASPLSAAILFGLIYVAVAALSLPGAAVLTLAAGALFGLAAGVLIASLASTIGATLAFLGTRYVFRDLVNRRFGGAMKSLNEGLKGEGVFYLLSLRLIPVFPFFMVNLLMGLTKVSVVRFFVVSQIGMLPGTFAYVYAGTQIAKIRSMADILSFEILLAFSLLGLVPLFAKAVISYLRSRRHISKFKAPKQFDYNVVVIGGGSAGLVTAYIASAVKAKVALVEKHKMGGDCLNTGCVPSKALIRSARVAADIKRASEFGIDVTDSQVRFENVMKRVHASIQSIEPHDSVDRYTALGVDCITGAAKILSPYEVQVNGQTLRTKNIVVATGARPLIPRIPGLENASPLTSDTVWNLKTQPKRLVVLGGGPIGCELAQAFARLGSQVTLVELSNRVLSREDEEVSELVSRRMREDGVKILTSHRAIRVHVDGTEKSLVCERNDLEVEVEFDQVLVALGRQPNTTGFGLEELGVELSPKGTIQSDQYLRTTNYPNIYVCGDVAGPFQFTHTAAHQAWYAAVNSLFSPLVKFKADYRVIPWCTFVDPEVARVGLNELEAKAQEISYEVTVYGIDDLDRAIVDGEAEGFVKVLTKPGSDQILGVTIVGAHAGEIIGEFVTAMKYGLGLNKILGTIHIYPTFSEANKYAAGVWKRKTAPQSLIEVVQRFHSWRRGEKQW